MFPSNLQTPRSTRLKGQLRFSLLWLTFAVRRLENLEGVDLYEGFRGGQDFRQENNGGEGSERVLSWNDFQTGYKFRTVTVLLHT